MPGGDGISGEAGEIFGSAAQMCFEDAMQRRLRYHLLRLTVAGLRRDEERAGASPLAFAIADIVERAGQGIGAPVSRRGVFTGAVLGAYAAVSSSAGMDQTTVAILGAIGGAVATPASTFIADRISEVGLSEYLSMKEN